MPRFLLWLHSYHDFVGLGQNGPANFDPFLYMYMYISYYPNAFSYALNTFIPQIFASSLLQPEASIIFKKGVYNLCGGHKVAKSLQISPVT